MHLALPVKPPTTQQSGLLATPQPRVHTAHPIPRVPTAPPPPRVQLDPPPLRVQIPTFPPWPRTTPHTPPPHIPTVTPLSIQTCNLTISPSGNTDLYYTDLLPHHCATPVMNPTTGMEAWISDLLAGRRVHDRVGEVMSEEVGLVRVRVPGGGNRENARLAGGRSNRWDVRGWGVLCWSRPWGKCWYPHPRRWGGKLHPRRWGSGMHPR